MRPDTAPTDFSLGLAGISTYLYAEGKKVIEIGFHSSEPILMIQESGREGVRNWVENLTTNWRSRDKHIISKRIDIPYEGLQ